VTVFRFFFPNDVLSICPSLYIKMPQGHHLVKCFKCQGKPCKSSASPCGGLPRAHQPDLNLRFNLWANTLCPKLQPLSSALRIAICKWPLDNVIYTNICMHVCLQMCVHAHTLTIMCVFVHCVYIETHQNIGHGVRKLVIVAFNVFKKPSHQR
jgi:hypothetical protein